MRVTVLGCGASTGVPAIGPNWGRCNPADPRNRRRRVSALVETGNLSILIDTSPDLREQLIDAKVSRLDAVIVTHAHADHLHGIDDLRSINRLMRQAIPLFADAKTLAEIGRRFGYVLEPTREAGRFHKSTLEPHEIRGPFEIEGVPVIPFAQDHGFSTTLGLRIGGFAYSTDVTELDETAFAALEGIELWVVDRPRAAAARAADPHGSEPRLSRAKRRVAARRRTGPRRPGHRAARSLRLRNSSKQGEAASACRRIL